MTGQVRAVRPAAGTAALGKAAGTVPPPLRDMAGAGGSGTCLGGLQWHRAVCRAAPFPRLALALGVSYSSAASIPGGVQRHHGGVPTPWPGRGAAQLSLVIPRQPLAVKWGTDAVPGPCQDPACAWAQEPLAADPFHAQGKLSYPPPRLLCPCPCAACSPSARPLSQHPWPKPCQASLLPVHWGQEPQPRGITLPGQCCAGWSSPLGLALAWGHPQCAPPCRWGPAHGLSKRS